MLPISEPDHAVTEEDSSAPELPVTLDMPGKVADFVRAGELDGVERAALDQGVAVRRGQGYTLRVTAVPAVHHRLLARCQPLGGGPGTPAIPTQRKARTGLAQGYRRFAQRSRDRFWARLHRVILDELGARGELDWSRCAIDSVSLRGGRRGPLTGPNPTDRGKLGSKTPHVATPSSRAARVVRSGLFFSEQRVSDFDEFVVGQLWRAPVPGSGVLDESRVQDDVVPLDVVGKVRVPEPLTVGEQRQSADQLALRA
jgi:hypothetical protein